VDEKTSHVQITLNPLDDLVRFKQSTQEYEANQFEITAEKGRKLLHNIRQDQRRKIHYSVRGGSTNPSSASSSSAGEDNSVETHNCLSWCRKHVKLIGFDMPLRWYNCLVTLPADVTRPVHAQTSNEVSSSSFSKCG
jgi:hypothetical protein